MLELLEQRGIEDRCVLAAVSVVPRSPFVAVTAEVCEVARRIQALELVGDEHLLQVGIGSGYATAVLSLLSAHVYVIEANRELVTAARRRIEGIGFDGITITCRDCDAGWAKHAPYDAILVTERHEEVPQALVAQLASGGRMVLVLRDRLVRVVKTGSSDVTVTDLGPAPHHEGN